MAIAILCLVSYSYSKRLPTFYSGIRLQYNGVDLRPVYSSSSTGHNYYSVPCVVDWNGDGKKDLLGGFFYRGWIYSYINSGTNSDPIFTSEELLKVGMLTISVGYG